MMNQVSESQNRSPSFGPGVVTETFLLAALLGAIVWTFPPDVNEAHYLAKARHVWDRDFCSNDIFVTSHESHWFFYITHGWQSVLFGFDAAAWIGRVTAWLATAWGLVLLSRCFDRRFGVAIVVGGLVVVLNDRLNLAGEWFAGGVEGKCYAYGFAFSAIAMWFSGKYRRAFIFGGLACAFHILVGSWFVVAGLLAITFATFSKQKMFANLRRGSIALESVPNVSTFFLTVLLLMIGFDPAMAGMFESVPGNISPVEASKIQSLDRLAHHQLASQFTTWFKYLPLVAIWFVLWRTNHRTNDSRVGNRVSTKLAELNLLITGSLIISACGVVLSLLATQLQAGFVRDTSINLLTLYFFRLADVLVPLGCVINGLVFVRRLPDLPDARKFALFCGIAVLGIAIAANAKQNIDDPRSGSTRQAAGTPSEPDLLQREIEAERNWIATCHWIRDNANEDSIFITPYNQQTFKWHALRSEVASRKDMPQNPIALLAWSDCLQLLYFGTGKVFESSMKAEETDFGFLPLGYRDQLNYIMQYFMAEYIIVEQRMLDEFLLYYELPNCLKQVYPETGQRKSTYVVFQYQWP